MNDNRHDDPTSSLRLRKRLRTIGALVLLVGISGAWLLYWFETRYAGPTMDQLLPGYAQADARQMGILYGGTGVLMSEGLEQLKRPDTQAIIIAAVSVLIALGCFYVARQLGYEPEAD
ncbi:MAG TPA: hypothetical protein VNE16_14380 [Vicinamibacterales bacterium]|nr:hypothetical protein [Vicinamibacterales bacterium]